MSQQIIFLYAFPLDRERRSLAESRGVSYPTIDEVKASIQEWKKIWDEINQDERILKRFVELTGAVLPYPVEAYVIGGMFNAMSRPFILVTHTKDGIARTKDEFIDACIHEVAHRFISVSNEESAHQKYWDVVAAEYPKEATVTQTHILIYALLKLIVPHYGGQGAWEACQKIENPAYQRAFDLMQAKGAEVCVEEFRKYLSV